ncbi:DNA repair protein RecN [Verrucomicrobiaceae bacterium N1E253]|uniref:DNA repair protein RecN n=1 Tax=Oceaniferula marina TaxID=2748318 RepID=A0A851GBE3_9BACT|nr:DNA repair protein RecN [Oceaniferula marina]NWK54489.1 DNA repair protein RecN [Oceaniferula marina]
MLSLLKIKNLALVDSLVWQLDHGLVGVTGETGAGKSVIVGALKLVLGERADKSLIRTGESTCTVEAVFDLPNAPLVNAILEDSGLDVCDDGQLIIRRVIGQSSNKQFVNNSPATLGVLKAVGEYLVDLHGPHDHQGLLSVDRQLAMLDAYAGVDPAEYQSSWRAWRERIDALEVFQTQGMAGERELDLLRHQLAEIDAAAPNPSEEEDLENLYRRASNSSHLLELASGAASMISGAEDSLLERMGQLQRQCRDLEKLDPGLREHLESVDRSAMELQEMEVALRDYLVDLNTDPEELLRLEERINTLETLKRKYGPSLDDVLLFHQEIAQRLDSVENRSERLKELEDEVASAREALDRAGLTMSESRRKAAPRLAKEIATHLKELGFKQAAFDVQLVANKEPESCGLESVEFGFGPNPGEPMKPLRQIASSGEISRVMLSVKSALAKQDATPLMVFDEIDANVGGEIARAVGEKMARLGERHQVVAITHFPQVAAMASRHFVVSKDVEGDRTFSRLEEVDGEGRIDEMVRMLGGGGGEVRAMAESLLA